MKGGETPYMHIRGTVTGTHHSDITSRRGPRTLTSVWVADHHDHTEIPSKQDSVFYEIQFLDTASQKWSDAIGQYIDTGQRVIAEIDDSFELVHVERDSGERTFIKARGIDIAASTLDAARIASAQH